jgi:hypothetical protein
MNGTPFTFLLQNAPGLAKLRFSSDAESPRLCLGSINKKTPFGVFVMVDLGYHFWNRFAAECDYLMMIIREYEKDKVASI